jgi:hypothetical protein
MLVEEHDRNKIVPCLLCKTPIRVGGTALRGGGAPTAKTPTPGP